MRTDWYPEPAEMEGLTSEEFLGIIYQPAKFKPWMRWAFGGGVLILIALIF